MMSFIFWGSSITLQVISADAAALLRLIDKENIPLYHIRQIDELTILLQIKKRDEQRLRILLKKCRAEVQTLSKNGFYWKLHSIVKRPVLIAGLAFLLLAGFYLPTRIFFFRVDGNNTIPNRMILEAAGEAGIRFGASAKDVRSERMKNALLQAIPKLQWAGINTSGCVATISVKERQTLQPTTNNAGVSSIVAIRDGIICDMTVTSGNARCKVGQAVSTGQILISGYTNCEQSIRATRSTGEIYAATNRSIEGILPTQYDLRGTQERIIKKTGIIFGKKRINFYSGSGILDSSCVKMYEENYVTLPGGFVLPVAIVTETWIPCQQQEVEITAEQNAQNLSTLSRQYLKNQMVAGSILSAKEQFSTQQGIITMTGEYGCIEMIGREQNEEIIKP